MREKGEDEQGEIFSTYDEFKRKVDRTVTTTHKFVRFMGRLGLVGASWVV